MKKINPFIIIFIKTTLFAALVFFIIGVICNKNILFSSDMLVFIIAIAIVCVFGYFSEIILGWLLFKNDVKKDIIPHVHKDSKIKQLLYAFYRYFALKYSDKQSIWYYEQAKLKELSKEDSNAYYSNATVHDNIIIQLKYEEALERYNKAMLGSYKFFEK